jgi:probable HAF family extracellular repeat protein
MNRQNRSPLSRLASLWLVILAGTGPVHGQAFRVVDLGIGDPYFPTALNNRGQILLTNNRLTPASIGAALAAGGAAGEWVGAASVLWDHGATSAIGLLPGGTYSRGCGLNDAGQVAGFGDTLWKFLGPVNGSLQVLHAFVWQGGGLTDLEPKVTVDDGETTFAVPIGSFATGINNQGEVTGAMTAQAPNPDDGAVIHAFRTAGGLIDHDADDISAGDPSFTRGWLINNAGTVLGWRSGPDGGGRSYFSSGGATPPADAAVYAMNDSGAIVGVQGEHAFASGVPGGLPGSFSAALGINNHGQIVGQGAGGDQEHALLFSDGQVIDLNDRLPAGSGWVLTQAALINDRGQIVVWGAHDGHSALGLLTPEAVSLTLSFQPDHVCRNDTATGLIRLSQPAGPGGLLVQLGSDPPLPELPLGVTVPAGQSEKSFTVPVSGSPGTTYQVTASFPSGTGLSTASAALAVAPPHLQALALSAAEISSDDSATLAMTLSCPAEPDGSVVTLELTGARNTERLDVPRSVTVAAGQTEAQIPIRVKAGETWPSGGDSDFTIKASAGGQSLSHDFTVHPTLHSFFIRGGNHPLPAIDSEGAYGGEVVTGVIVLSQPAPAGGRAVQVKSFDPAAAPVNPAAPDQPLTVVIPEGQDTAEIPIQTQPGVTSDVVFQASTPTSHEEAQVRIVPAPPGMTP